MDESCRRGEKLESNREYAIDADGGSGWGENGSHLEEGKGHGGGGRIRMK